MSPTDRRSSNRPGGRARVGGFTMVEVLIGSTLSVVILAGVMTSFLMLGRSGYNAASYSIMEAEARRALETFSQDARMSVNLTWHSSSSVTLRVTSSGATQNVTYVYDSSTSGPTAQSFYRYIGTPASPGTARILVRDVTDFAFRRYKVVNGVDFTANNDLETKQIQITLRSVRARTTVVSATNAVLSARIVLRNKPVST
jgi:hypothetical protein